jgi:photosystem II stability/assembly factor-like uncharacterized protein
MKRIFLLLLIYTGTINSQYWVEQVSGVTTQLYTVSGSAGSNAVWTAGESGVILRTTNGGTNWLMANTGIPPAALIYNIWSVDGSTAIAAGMNGTTSNIWRTSNGGTNWQVVLSQANGFFNCIAMKSSNPLHGLVQGDPVGGRWSIWKTSNGGVNWDSAGCYLPQNGTEAGWNNSIYIGSQDIGFGNDSLIWFGTNNSRIYFSSNFGITWTAQSTAPEANNYALHFNAYFIPGDGLSGGATLMRTSNMGVNWTTQTTVGTGNFCGLVMFPAPVDFYGYCWYTRLGSSIIYRGMNGSNWAAEYTAPSGTYNHFANLRQSTVCYGVRSNGGITRCNYWISSVNHVSSEVPESYSLNQNYPNPFNPVTNFGFRIAGFELVRLTVFDAIGREVEVLVNQQLQLGTYAVSWDASAYPSGVYFYKLESGNFTETKKMVLIK